MTARRRGAQVEALPRKLSYTRPKGEQLQEILEGVIAALQPGALLPSERLLADRYGVARAPVTQDMRARGMTPGSVVRSQAVVPASEVVARHLAIVPGSPVVHLERVRTADGEPMALERTHLPAQRLPGLESADLAGASLYELLERRWGVRVADADQWASVVRLTDDEAALLQVAPDQPALLFQRLTRDPSGTPLEYVRSLNDAAPTEIYTRLERLDT